MPPNSALVGRVAKETLLFRSIGWTGLDPSSEGDRVFSGGSSVRLATFSMTTWNAFCCLVEFTARGVLDEACDFGAKISVRGYTKSVQLTQRYLEM